MQKGGTVHKWLPFRDIRQHGKYTIILTVGRRESSRTTLIRSNRSQFLNAIEEHFVCVVVSEKLFSLALLPEETNKDIKPTSPILDNILL